MSDLDYYELDDTSDELAQAGNKMEQALRNEHDIPDDASVFIYEVDADVSERKFELGVLIEE